MVIFQLICHGHCRRPDSKAAAEQKAALKAQLNRAYDALRLKRQEQENLTEDIASDEAHLDNLRAEAETLHSLVESLLQRKVMRKLLS